MLPVPSKVTSLQVGDLCVISPRGREVFGYEIFGAYPAPDPDKADSYVYETLKNSGELMDRAIAGVCDKRAIPFISLTGRKIPSGSPVIVSHAPIIMTRSGVRKQIGMNRNTMLCEVLYDCNLYWVKAGLLRKHATE